MGRFQFVVLLGILLSLTASKSECASTLKSNPFLGNGTMTSSGKVIHKRHSANEAEPWTFTSSSKPHSRMYDFDQKSSFKRRAFAFPKGTEISLTPTISIPMITPVGGDAPVDLSAQFKTSLPLTMTFNDLSVGFLGEAFRDPSLFYKKASSGVSYFPEVVNFPQNNFVLESTKRSLKSHTRKARDLLGVNSRNRGESWKISVCPERSLLERKLLLQKVETILKVGLGFTNARDCVLRAVCELHEVSGINDFGLLADTLIFAISFDEALRRCKGNHAIHNFFLPFAKAERSGKKWNCRPFTEKCDASLFTS